MEALAELSVATAQVKNAIAAYDPNIGHGTHDVQLTFKMWDYQAVHTIQVHGAMRGFELLEYAIEALYEKLFEADDDITDEFELRNAKGEVMVGTHAADVEQDFEWFKSLCVDARIVDYTPAEIA
jgi:hypothetical protein